MALLDSFLEIIELNNICVQQTLSHGNSYIFYEVANSYDLTRTI